MGKLDCHQSKSSKENQPGNDPSVFLPSSSWEISQTLNTTCFDLVLGDKSSLVSAEDANHKELFNSLSTKETERLWLD
jgi:hypothetical protein